MPVHIHHIDTAVPATHYTQEFSRDLMKKNVSEKKGIQSIIHRIYNNSGISKRHSVIRDFNPGDSAPLFFNKDGRALPSPGTKTRNEAYIQEAKPLFSQLAKKTIEKSAGFNKEDITHVITVSCTGFFAPGPDFHIVKELGLDPSTQRFHIGFMGCYAAFPALKMAAAFCEADPQAVVLIVCVELCTLHLQLHEEMDFIISASVFADGAGSALVSARQPDEGRASMTIKQFGSDITKSGEEDMAWTVGDTGFDMTLSTYVPEIIKANIGEVVARQLGDAGMNSQDIDQWAIHPGGRLILDKIQQSMGLTDRQIFSSRNTLKHYGNMSSATVLFVLKDLLNNIDDSAPTRNIMGMAFGPGLTIETGIFEVSPAFASEKGMTDYTETRAITSPT